MVFHEFTGGVFGVCALIAQGVHTAPEKGEAVVKAPVYHVMSRNYNVFLDW